MVLRRVPRFARPDTDPHDRPANSTVEIAPAARSGDRFRSAGKAFRRMELARWLVQRHGLDPQHARSVADRLLASAPALRGAFRRWWLTGGIDDVEVEGYSLRRLVEEKEMSPLGALLALSLLQVDSAASGEDLDRRPAGDLRPEEALERRMS